MLSPSSRLALRVLYRRTPIPSAVQSIRKNYRKAVYWLKKAALPPSHEEVRQQDRISLQEAKTPPLLNLPLELFLKIDGLLSLESQVCLALTCKALFEFNKHALTAPQFRFFPGNVYDGQYMKNSDNFNTKRWQLLCLLENEQWHCCSTCLKLHPISQFSNWGILTQATGRVCTLGKVGIVNLCSDLNITFRDRNKITEQLKAENTLNCVYLLHKCFSSFELTDVVTKISALINEDDELFIYTQYAVFARGLSIYSIEPLCRVFCPHLPFYYFFRYFAYSESERDMPYSTLSRDCPEGIPSEAYQRGLYCQYCDTTIYVIKSNIKSRGYRRNCFFEVVTVRNLGQGKCANDTWQYQTVYPSSWNGFGYTPRYIHFPSSLPELRDSLKHNLWRPGYKFCFRCIPTLTENKSHCWPAVLQDPLTSNEIPPEKEHLFDSDINIEAK